eukprot:TRINITY_DN25121_c0_g1_i1.p1 TRINITY_DN25121_c0_g1~~TRINITY_DN25121_c0_g1_i1.p1  ORF type:complete len:450 (-),score=47.01 TRINITY_DN25121_c0_g1_i1:35-1384(-)
MAKNVGASLGRVVLTLLKNMIGSGLFSLPVGFWVATPYIGITVLAFIGFLSASTFWMVGYCCITWRVNSFRELWEAAFGRSSAWIIDVVLFFTGYLTLVTYIVLIGDFTTKSFSGLLGPDHVLSTNRWINQWTITASILLPLSLAKDLTRLAFTSALGLGIMLYVFCIVIFDYWSNASAEWNDNVVLAELRFGCFEAVALYTHAFVAHYNAPKIFSELANPTHERWFSMVALAYSLAFLVYAIFAWCGFSRFQGTVKGNVLRNYEPSFAILVAWLGMGFAIAFTYPLSFNAMREAAVNLYTVLRRQPRFIALFGTAPTERAFSANTLTFVSVALVVLTGVASMFCEDLGVVNALAGSIMGCMIAFVMPACLFFQTARSQLKRLKENSGGASAGLVRPLLPGNSSSGRWRTTLSRRHLLLAMFAGAFAFVAGLAFTIIGTAVILHRASTA